MKPIYLSILLLLFSCNTTKKNENKKNVKTNPLLNTCWAIDYEVKNNDTIKMNIKVNLQFKEHGFCNMSGMDCRYELAEDGFILEDIYYRIIKLTKKELVVEKNLDKYLKPIQIFHRISCDSVNDIFKDFYLPENIKK